jgi:hypothetical protein
LTDAFKEAWLKRVRLNAFGNGENWCKLYMRLDDEGKQHLIKFF